MKHSKHSLLSCPLPKSPPRSSLQKAWKHVPKSHILLLGTAYRCVCLTSSICLNSESLILGSQVYIYLPAPPLSKRDSLLMQQLHKIPKHSQKGNTSEPFKDNILPSHKLSSQGLKLNQQREPKCCRLQLPPSKSSVSGAQRLQHLLLSPQPARCRAKYVSFSLFT